VSDAAAMDGGGVDGGTCLRKPGSLSGVGGLMFGIILHFQRRIALEVQRPLPRVSRLLLEMLNLLAADCWPSFAV